MLLSLKTVQELSEVLEREKFDNYVDRETRRELLLSLIERAKIIEVETKIRKSRDSDDDKFLELAVEAEAECIVSGDQNLLVLKSIQGIPILTAHEFLQRSEGE